MSDPYEWVKKITVESTGFEQFNRPFVTHEERYQNLLEACVKVERERKEVIALLQDAWVLIKKMEWHHVVFDDYGLDVSDLCHVCDMCLEDGGHAGFCEVGNAITQLKAKLESAGVFPNRRPPCSVCGSTDWIGASRTKDGVWTCIDCERVKLEDTTSG